MLEVLVRHGFKPIAPLKTGADAEVGGARGDYVL